MHVVAVVTLDGAGGIDIAMPCMIFGQTYPRPLRHGKRALYDVRVCGPEVTTTFSGGRKTFKVTPPYPLAEAAEADTILVPGLNPHDVPPPPEIIDLLRDAHRRGVRIGSICNGVFVLAAAGLLDGRRAAVHWGHAAELAAHYPDIQVEDSVLYIDDGDIVTSAGGAAALDLCLHLVRRDFGSAVAAQTARLTVMPLQRDGGQAQFIHHAEPESGGSLEPVMEWMEDRLDHDLTLAEIAERAATSVRTLNRTFRAQTGTTPLQWLIQRRLQRARELLETTDLSVEEIASRAGFGTAIGLRQHFRRVVGTTPLAYRRSFAPDPARSG